jgi:hypothetical protein
VVDRFDLLVGLRLHPRIFDTRQEARVEAVELYELHTGPMGCYELNVEVVRRDLASKDLACWCPLPEPGETDWCHARILLEIANGGHDA